MRATLRSTLAAVGLTLSLATFAFAQGGVDVCGPTDNRTNVPVWEPVITDVGEFSDEPPQGDGLVIFASFAIDNSEADCANADAERLYSFSARSNDPQLEGLAVNLRGNVQFANAICHFRGFFKNEAVAGLHQGWAETYFGAVDKYEIVSSGRYCLERSPTK